MNNFQARMLEAILELHCNGEVDVKRLYYSPDATPGYIDITIGLNKVYIFKHRAEGVHNGAAGSVKPLRKVNLSSTPEVLGFCRKAVIADMEK